MKKVLYPEISLYSELVLFFQDFYTLNKEANKSFSYRSLAKKLHWSAPYLNDLFKGRKQLSLKRALEFAEFVGFSGVETERFLFLYLADAHPEFSKSKIKSEVLASHNSDLKNNVSPEDFAKFETVFDFYIFYYLYYNNGHWDSEDFLRKLTLPTKPSLNTVESIISRLLKTGFLVFDDQDNKYKVIEPGNRNITTKKEEGEAIDQILKNEREFVRNYLNFLDQPTRRERRAFVSGTINLNPELFLEARERITALYNYLLELSLKAGAESEKNSVQPGPEGKAWQFSINLFSLFEDQKK